MATSVAGLSIGVVTPGPVTAGSQAHKRLFCGLMLDTHDPYDPDRIA